MLTTNQKIKALMKISMRLFNPDVMYTYTGRGEVESEATTQTKKVLRQNLTIKPDDTPTIAIFKILIFFMVCGRFIGVASSPITLYPVMRNRSRTHLKCYYKPAKRGATIITPEGRMTRAPYHDFSIPNYIGPRKPKIPNFTYGAWTIIATFTDQSYIELHTNTKEEGVKMILDFCKYVDPKYHPKGGMKESLLRISEPNIERTRRYRSIPTHSRQRSIHWRGCYSGQLWSRIGGDVFSGT